MTNAPNRMVRMGLPALFAFAVGIGFTLTGAAQNSEMQQRVAEIKEAAAKNKQALS